MIRADQSVRFRWVVGLAMVILPFLGGTAAAQSLPDPQPEPPGIQAGAPANQMEAENRSKMDIRLEEERHKELRGNCAELESLAKSFADRWENTSGSPQLREEDQKNLRRIEKLARKVRSTQGGEDDEDLLKTLPRNFNERAKLLAKLATELKGDIEKSNRHTVSVGVIVRATRLIALTKLLTSGRVS